MYIFSNLIIDDDGKIVGEFRDHYTAYTALQRLRDQNWKQLNPVWNEDDSIAEKKFHARIGVNRKA